MANQSLSYRVTGQFQHAKTPIAPADYFTIGNRYAVRGFDGQRTLASENGWTLRNDLSLNLAGLIGVPGQELYTGLDVGRVGGAFAQYLSGRMLVGTVIGWRGRFALPFGAVSYDLSVGWPLHKPSALKTARPVGSAALLFEL